VLKTPKQSEEGNKPVNRAKKREKNFKKSRKSLCAGVGGQKTCGFKRGKKKRLKNEGRASKRLCRRKSDGRCGGSKACCQKGDGIERKACTGGDWQVGSGKQEECV